jgi:hypothetical protein
MTSDDTTKPTLWMMSAELHYQITDCMKDGCFHANRVLSFVLFMIVFVLMMIVVMLILQIQP